MNGGFRIEDVEMSFEGERNPVRALGPISLDIEAGEFVCIVGESGCGKSTLLRLLAGLEKPTRGQIFMDGAPLDGPSSERGFVFQQPALLPWLTVEENMLLGFKIRRAIPSRQVIRSTIEMVGLTGFEHTRPHKLSGGMQQRAAIATVLVNTPRAILMDEPFSALDAITRRRMQRELTRIWQANNLTVVFVTHDTEEAVALATRIVLMTPRPGRVARVFQLSLDFPRPPASIDVLRMKALVAEEFMDVVQEAAANVHLGSPTTDVRRNSV
jgi:ABC-type nitrate/sulfonate/bicarbonate transport system ATPase subunit